MSTVGYTPPGGTHSTYPYKLGALDWNGRQLSAVILGPFPVEGGLQVRSIVANRILAEHKDVSDGEWVVFIRRPLHVPGPEWELIGSGHGRQPLSEGEAIPANIPAGVLDQLEAIFAS
jgi:hypothetical protein